MNVFLEEKEKKLYLPRKIRFIENFIHVPVIFNLHQ